MLSLSTLSNVENIEGLHEKAEPQGSAYCVVLDTHAQGYPQAATSMLAYARIIDELTAQTRGQEKYVIPEMEIEKDLGKKYFMAGKSAHNHHRNGHAQIDGKG